MLPSLLDATLNVIKKDKDYHCTLIDDNTNKGNNLNTITITTTTITTTINSTITNNNPRNNKENTN